MMEYANEIDWMLEKAKKNPMKIHHDVETRMRVWSTQILPGRLQEIIASNGDPDYIKRMINLTIDDYDRICNKIQKEFIINKDINLYHELNNQMLNITQGIIELYESETKE